MRINKDRIIKEFQTLVLIDSPSFGEQNMCAYLKEQLLELGMKVREDDAGERLDGTCGNLHSYLEGTVPGDPVLFSAHMDTVEPSRGKLAVIQKDGRITSNGDTILGADDCSGIVAILEALRTIKEKNIKHPPIEVLFTIAEEVYCKGVSEFDFEAIKAKEAYVLDLSAEIGTAARKAPTILSFSVTVNGRASHSGFAPEAGIHAIACAADAITHLKMGRIDEDTTFNIGMIDGGLASNIIPAHCTVKGEIRSYSHSSALRLEQEVKNVFAASAANFGALIQFHSVVNCEAYDIPENTTVIKRFRKACEIQGITPNLIETFGGSDNNQFVKCGIDGIVVANAMHQCHSCEEYTTMEELYQVAEMTVSLMTDNLK